MEDINPKDYYFSTPKILKDEGEDIESTHVIIVAKSQWDGSRIVGESHGETYALGLLGKILSEAEENIFEANGQIDCADLKKRLTDIGMQYNPDLDVRLVNWAKNYNLILEENFSIAKASEEYYFSTPFPAHGFTNNLKVVIVPKAAYDRNGEWQDGGAEYRAMDVPGELSESSENIFEAENPMTKQEIENLLKSKGFIHNPKLDSDVMATLDVPASYYAGLEKDIKKSPTRPRVYMMVGLPASGKSTQSKWFEGLHAKFVSQDLCNGSKSQARKQLENLLEQGETIVVDDTNYNREVRSEIIDLAKRYNPVNLTAIYMDVDKQTCLERNKTRQNKVPDVAIHTIAKKFEPPTLDEGFTDILVFNKNGKGSSG